MVTETTTTEVTEFDDGSKIIETKTVESEFIEGDTPPVSEVVEVPVVEEPSTEIILAEIAADVEHHRIDAQTEQAEIRAASDVEFSGWQQNIEAQMTALRETVETLVTSLIQPKSGQEVPPSPKSDLPDESVDPISESPEKAPEPAPKPRKKLRWI